MLRSSKKLVLMVTLSVVFALLTSQVWAASPIRKAIFSLEKSGGPVHIDVDATCLGGATLLIEETEEEFEADEVDGNWHLEPETLESNTPYTVTITCTNKAGTKTTTGKYSFWFKGSTIKAAPIKKTK